MPLKRQLRASEIPIFDNTYTHQRGDYWQLHMWLERERQVCPQELAYTLTINRCGWAKQFFMEISAAQLSGKTCFSLTVKQVVKLYLAAREQDVELGLITRDRYITLRSQRSRTQGYADWGRVRAVVCGNTCVL